MIVVPLVFASLSLGVAGVGDLRKLGRIGLRTFALFLLFTCLASGLSLLMVNVIQPGRGLTPEGRERLLATYRQQAQQTRLAAGEARLGIQTLVNIVPRNPLAAAAQGDMLGLIFFSLIFGAALALLPEARSAPLREVLRGLGEAMVVIIDLVMKLAPYGVFALVFSVAARFGLDLLARLGWYVATVVAGLAIFQFGVYGFFVRGLGGRSPTDFFRRIWPVVLTAFSTSSSNATLPTALRVSETALDVPRNIAGFVLPLGATINMNGTALFEGATVLFIAQVLGLHLGFPVQAVVLVMAVLTAIGTAGVPGGSIPLLILVLEAVGVPGEGIAMVIGVDRLLDMCRTVVNVTGDMATATIIARREGNAFPA
jgi:DAACS family dicarboxylate/amino acid:cation (Na+ or H+) symporter